VLSVVVTRDNKHIISGSADKTIKVWDIIEKIKEIKCFKDAHDGWVNSVAITSDNNFIVSG
jgi:WD40 repeat protein